MLTELRCTRCHHLLAKINFRESLEKFGSISIKCEDCKLLNTFDHDPTKYVNKSTKPTASFFEE